MTGTIDDLIDEILKTSSTLKVWGENKEEKLIEQLAAHGSQIISKIQNKIDSIFKNVNREDPYVTFGSQGIPFRGMGLLLEAIGKTKDSHALSLLIHYASINSNIVEFEGFRKGAIRGISLLKAANVDKATAIYSPSGRASLSPAPCHIPLDLSTLLEKSEYITIQELERLVGKAIPIVTEVESSTFGLVIQDRHVVQLGCYKSELTSLPETIGNLQSLQILDLDYNNITSFPETIGNLQSLQTLRLIGNKLTSLPEVLGQLSSLESLVLYDNQLDSLPETFKQLSSLEYLGISKNNLALFPQIIFELKSLKELLLSENMLEFIPDTIGNLKSLTLLYLGDNQLTSLPESIGKLKSLTLLNLSNNQLSSLPESIGKLKSLLKLELYENRLSSLPESIGQLKSLQRLRIGHNRLTPLSKSVEKSFETLKKCGCHINYWD